VVSYIGGLANGTNSRDVRDVKAPILSHAHRFSRKVAGDHLSGAMLHRSHQQYQILPGEKTKSFPGRMQSTNMEWWIAVVARLAVAQNVNVQDPLD